MDKLYKKSIFASEKVNTFSDVRPILEHWFSSLAITFVAVSGFPEIQFNFASYSQVGQTGHIPFKMFVPKILFSCQTTNHRITVSMYNTIHFTKQRN